MDYSSNRGDTSLLDLYEQTLLVMTLYCLTSPFCSISLETLQAQGNQWHKGQNFILEVWFQDYAIQDCSTCRFISSETTFMF